jgi:hypothetical protein
MQVALTIKAAIVKESFWSLLGFKMVELIPAYRTN